MWFFRTRSRPASAAVNYPRKRRSSIGLRPRPSVPDGGWSQVRLTLTSFSHQPAKVDGVTFGGSVQVQTLGCVPAPGFSNSEVKQAEGIGQCFWAMPPPNFNEANLTWETSVAANAACGVGELERVPPHHHLERRMALLLGLKSEVSAPKILMIFVVGLLLSLSLSITSTKRADLPQRYNGTGKEVMLQGFHWTSYNPKDNGNKHWYQIITENAKAIKETGFDYVWFPPPSRSSAGDNSYLPNEWYTLENGYGNKEELKQAVAALKPTMALCDIVINHRCGTATGGADFTNPAFGNGEENKAAVVTGDECQCGKGKFEERHRDGSFCEGNPAGRDLDHTNPLVQARVKEFQQKLKNEIGFAGWRYDQVRGYNGFSVGLYNDASKPTLSVGEFWDNNAQKVVDWVDETAGKSMAFDFPTRDALVGALLKQDYGRLKTLSGKPPGLIGLWSEMSVTFIENHDTEPVRDRGNKRFPDDKIMPGYVYILTHPGIPCVFWRHFFDQGEGQKTQIIKLIAIRKQAGITSRSSLFIEPNTEGKYAAVIDGKVAMKIGPASWSPGEGWEIALDGPDYAVWTKKGP